MKLGFLKSLGNKAKALSKTSASTARAVSNSPYAREFGKGMANATGAIAAITTISMVGTAVQRHNAHKRYDALPRYRKIFTKRPR